MGCVRTALQVAKSKKLTVLCHFLFSVEIGISGFGSSTSSVFTSVLLWYKMLICYFSIKKLDYISLLIMELHATFNLFKHARCGKKPQFYGKMGADKLCGCDRPLGTVIEQQGTQDGRESFGAHKIASQFTCLLFSQQLLHTRNLFKKKSFVKRQKNIMHIV